MTEVERTTPSAAAGLLGSSLSAIAATSGFGSAMENLISNNSVNQNQENIRRASTPSANSNASAAGGFSSIFNLKSVINAAKTSQPPTIPVSNSNFYVPSSAVSDQPIAESLPLKSVQGRKFIFLQAFCVFKSKAFNVAAVALTNVNLS